VDDLVDVTLEVLEAQLYEPGHLEEIRRDEYRDDGSGIERRWVVGLVDVLHQPLEDVHVAVDRDIDIVVPAV